MLGEGAQWEENGMFRCVYGSLSTHAMIELDSTQGIQVQLKECAVMVAKFESGEFGIATYTSGTPA